MRHYLALQLYESAASTCPLFYFGYSGLPISAMGGITTWKDAAEFLQAVWKTIGPPVLNVSNRYGSWNHGGQRMLGINNVELISDRPRDVNLREIAEVKRAWPDRAVVVSAMAESKPEAWQEIIRRIEDTGADGIELNYGCPHGMSERGMGAATRKLIGLPVGA